MELGEWLLSNGAESVLLLSRRGATGLSGYQQRKLKTHGGKLVPVICDVTDEAALEQVIVTSFSVCRIRQFIVQ